jgi:hypothetical protein
MEDYLGFGCGPIALDRSTETGFRRLAYLSCREERVDDLAAPGLVVVGPEDRVDVYDEPLYRKVPEKVRVEAIQRCLDQVGPPARDHAHVDFHFWNPRSHRPGTAASSSGFDDLSPIAPFPVNIDNEI